MSIIEFHFFIPITASKNLLFLLNKICTGMAILHFIFRSEKCIAWSSWSWKEKSASLSNWSSIRGFKNAYFSDHTKTLLKNKISFYCIFLDAIFNLCVFYPDCASIYVGSINIIKACCTLDCRTMHAVHSAINLIFLTRRFTAWITSLVFCFHIAYLNAATA